MRNCAVARPRIAKLDAPGYSIGGLSVGEGKPDMWAITEVVNANCRRTGPDI